MNETNEQPKKRPSAGFRKGRGVVRSFLHNPSLIPALFLLAAACLAAVLLWLLWTFVPRAPVRWGILSACTGLCALAGLWVYRQRRQTDRFADELCETLDALLSDQKPRLSHPYDDSLASRVQGKLMQYYEFANEGRLQSRRDKETIQGLVSDISHQVKTPIANIRMFAEILQKHNLSDEQRNTFLATMTEQIDKLDFLLQSLIKMSRLETGTFVLHMAEGRLNETIARAMSTVWTKAEQKGICLSADCADDVSVQHDPRWTAEALGNILDNAVKYTPESGSVSVSVRPWQFYTRIDITDTGIGIPEEHYHDVFRRFYRGEEAAAMEGVGLGLYLANGIITRQKGYISVASKVGKGTTFSIYLLS